MTKDIAIGRNMDEAGNATVQLRLKDDFLTSVWLMTKKEKSQYPKLSDSAKELYGADGDNEIKLKDIPDFIKEIERFNETYNETEFNKRLKKRFPKIPNHQPALEYSKFIIVLRELKEICQKAQKKKFNVYAIAD